MEPRAAAPAVGTGVAVGFAEVGGTTALGVVTMVGIGTGATELEAAAGAEEAAAGAEEAAAGAEEAAAGAEEAAAGAEEAAPPAAGGLAQSLEAAGRTWSV